jgi:hypothetical protein
VKFKRNSFKRSRPVVPLFVVFFFFLACRGETSFAGLSTKAERAMKNLDRVMMLSIDTFLIGKELWCAPDPMGPCWGKAEGGGGDVTVVGWAMGMTLRTLRLLQGGATTKHILAHLSTD